MSLIAFGIASKMAKFITYIHICFVLGHRYIELFLRSEFDDGGDDWSTGDQSFFSGNGMNFSNNAGGERHKLFKVYSRFQKTFDA